MQQLALLLVGRWERVVFKAQCELKVRLEFDLLSRYKWWILFIYIYIISFLFLVCETGFGLNEGIIIIDLFIVINNYY